jgi:aryl-alcohol dehydrogenase-like predicted oxidoreductase
MEYRIFGETGMKLSVVGIGGLLAHYEGVLGSEPPEEKRRIYLRAVELGINLFDMGYGDEVHIPDELKGNRDDLHFALKLGGPPPKELSGLLEKHLKNLRRDYIDILRVHYSSYLEINGLPEAIADLKSAGKIRSLCLIRHDLTDQDAYMEKGPEPESDGDLVAYNYVYRYQEPGIAKAAQAGKGVLIMKALGGQWLSWEDMTTTDWKTANEETVVKLAVSKHVKNYLDLIYPIVSGPWHELVEPGETIPRTERAIRWVLKNSGVNSILVAVANVVELEEAVGRK